MTLNGILAGLVGITAGADQMAMGSSIAIGLIAGVIVARWCSSTRSRSTTRSAPSPSTWCAASGAPWRSGFSARWPG